MTLLLKPEEAAKELGVGRDRVYQLLKSGALLSVKIGNSRRIRYSDLEAYVASLAPNGQAGAS